MLCARPSVKLALECVRTEFRTQPIGIAVIGIRLARTGPPPSEQGGSNDSHDWVDFYFFGFGVDGGIDLGFVGVVARARGP